MHTLFRQIMLLLLLSASFLHADDEGDFFNAAYAAAKIFKHEDDLKAVLKDFDGRQVNIRGFAYRTCDERVLFSQEPNLRSCCVGSQAKVHNQIFLSNLAEEIDANWAVTIQGTLLLRPQYDGKNNLIALWCIDDARIIQPHTPWFSLACALAGLLCLFLLFGWTHRFHGKQ